MYKIGVSHATKPSFHWTTEIRSDDNTLVAHVFGTDKLESKNRAKEFINNI